jgi:hypothetical protein
MNRRVIIRVLLSLLLLVTQQMATMHVMSHWTGSLATSVRAELDQENGLSAAIAQDQTCHQCLAFAQFAGMLANSTRAFATPDLVAPTVAFAASAVQCRHSACPFQSRAPPVAI